MMLLRCYPGDWMDFSGEEQTQSQQDGVVVVWKLRPVIFLLWFWMVSCSFKLNYFTTCSSSWAHSSWSRSRWQLWLEGFCIIPIEYFSGANFGTKKCYSCLGPCLIWTMVLYGLWSTLWASSSWAMMMYPSNKTFKMNEKLNFLYVCF